MLLQSPQISPYKYPQCGIIQIPAQFIWPTLVSLNDRTSQKMQFDSAVNAECLSHWFSHCLMPLHLRYLGGRVAAKFPSDLPNALMIAGPHDPSHHPSTLKLRPHALLFSSDSRVSTKNSDTWHCCSTLHKCHNSFCVHAISLNIDQNIGYAHNAPVYGTPQSLQSINITYAL